MSDTAYNTIAAYSTGEYTEKKSRFIADAYPARTPDEAASYLAMTQKKYPDARHHCYAYVLGTRSETSKMSDNGEPSGTAGKPILEVIHGAGLTDIIIIVTRYFGGTLLGTGGLVRAYTKAAQEAISHATVTRMVYGKTMTIAFSYDLVNTIQYYLDKNGIAFSNPVYASDVSYDITVPSGDTERITQGLIEKTDGNIVILEGDTGWHATDTA